MTYSLAASINYELMLRSLLRINAVCYLSRLHCNTCKTDKACLRFVCAQNFLIDLLTLIHILSIESGRLIEYPGALAQRWLSISTFELIMHYVVLKITLFQCPT